MTDKDAIRDLQQKWFHATTNGDVSGIKDLMTEDVVFLTPGRAPFGRQEFIDSFKAMNEHIAIDCEGEYIEIAVDGDLAYAVARLEITVTPKNGDALKQLSGNVLSVFKRLPDGTWRLSRDANMLTTKSA